jgi:hypothetical protein
MIRCLVCRGILRGCSTRVSHGCLHALLSWWLFSRVFTMMFAWRAPWSPKARLKLVVKAPKKQWGVGMVAHEHP